VRGASVFASTLPLPQVKAKIPVNTNAKKEEPEVRLAIPLKEGDYAYQWVKNYATELEAYHQLWQKEAYPESIEMMELVRGNVTKFVANLCHIAGKKLIDKGLFKEALDLLKKGYSYDRSDRALAEELHTCYHFLIVETLNKGEYAITKKLLADGLILNPGNKEWRRLQGSLRNISKNKHNNSKF
jgi:tetratricopeptide (TPR) repeat protein